MPVNLALVHLGKNPSPILMEMAQLALQRLEGSSIFLVTDNPDDWANFPGKIINYSRLDRDNYVTALLQKFPELERVAGGYWLYTLERLSALQKVYEYVGFDEAVLHFESDVLLLLNHSDLDLIVRICKKCACPRFSKDRGIASIFFVPDHSKMSLFLDSVEVILARNNHPMNDMELLGVCLNENVIVELPSLPKNAWKNSSGENLVFDGAAYGQYLFGQDPFHTGGRRISGFQNPDFPLDLTSLDWKISKDKNSKSQSVFISQNDIEYRILNLHLHSKIRLNSASTEDAQWKQAVDEANGVSPRTYGGIEANFIHTQKISFLDRLRLARRRGVTVSLANYIDRRLRLLNQKINLFLTSGKFISTVKKISRPARLYFRLHNRWTRPFYGKYFGLSQLDAKIEKYLPIKNGYFVELGANDGISQSNTKYFEVFRGWKGVLIEAYEPNYRKCLSNRKKSTKCFNAACVSFDFPSSKVKFLYSNLMSISLHEKNEILNREAHANEGSRFLKSHEEVHTFEAQARTLNSILHEAGAPNLIDLLSLDVEGLELEVLAGINHNEYRFKYICVEARNFEKMDTFMKGCGYELIERLTTHDLLYKNSR